MVTVCNHVVGVGTGLQVKERGNQINDKTLGRQMRQTGMNKTERKGQEKARNSTRRQTSSA